jgi:hypothetical protein
MSCVCPAGQKTQKVVSISSGDRYGAPGIPLRAFRFDATICDSCPLRSSCVRACLGKGRLVMIHPQEALLQEARAFQQSEAFAPYRKLRQAAEHRLARLMQLGVRQARYFGRTKTLFQLLMAATVANLTLVARRIGLMRDRNPPQTSISIHVYALFMFRHAFTTLPLRSEPGFSATLLGCFVGEAPPLFVPCIDFPNTPIHSPATATLEGRSPRLRPDRLQRVLEAGPRVGHSPLKRLLLIRGARIKEPLRGLHLALCPGQVLPRLVHRTPAVVFLHPSSLLHMTKTPGAWERQGSYVG